MNIRSTLNVVKRNSLTNNTQRVAYKLLSANGSWVSRSDLGRVSASAPARARDLRKPQFGQFEVECEPARALKRNAKRNSFLYRIHPGTVTKQQVETVFII